jgi:hypothetical protein
MKQKKWSSTLTIVDDFGEMRESDISEFIAFYAEMLISGKYPSDIIAKDFNNLHGLFTGVSLRYSMPDTAFRFFDVCSVGEIPTVSGVVEALQYFDDTGDAIACVFQSTMDNKEVPDLQTICQKITNQGKYIFAAGLNRSKEVTGFPAAFSNVVSVEFDPTLNSGIIQKKKQSLTYLLNSQGAYPFPEMDCGNCAALVCLLARAYREGRNISSLSILGVLEKILYNRI